MYGGEITHKGEPCPNGQAQPQNMFIGFLNQLFYRKIAFIQVHTRTSIAFNFALNPHEYFAVHRLRTGIATPQSTRHRGEQEERQRRHDQHTGQVNKVLGIQHQAKHIKAFGLQVKQHSLALPPFQPR